MRCPRCGNENQTTNRFCGMCGATLLPPATPADVPSQGTASQPTSAQAAPPATPTPQQAPRTSAPVSDEAPVISGPSFLGLNEPSPATRSRAGLSIDPRTSSSRNLDYLLEDDEEPKHGGAGKWILMLVALALAVGFGYLRWKDQGFSWLNSGPKKPAAATSAADDSNASPASAPAATPAPAANPPAPNQPATATGSQPAPDSTAPSSSPAVSNPAASNPAASNPAASNPAASNPAASNPPASSPAASTPTPGSSATSTPTTNAASPSAAPASSAPAATNAGSPNSASPTTAPATKEPAPKNSNTNDSSDDTSDSADTDKPKAAPVAAPKPTPARPARTLDPVTEAQKYIYGKGAPQDCDRGMRLLKPAADQSNTKAMVEMGALYSAGLCTPRDLPTAYRWFALALRKDPDNQSVQADLQKLWGEMTQPERQLAIRLSQ